MMDVNFVEDNERMEKMVDRSNPLVSVVVPCYNHEEYITVCIESIVNQTYGNFELIVIDDGSKDSSPDLLKELQKKYNFTLVIQENIGLSATLNKALKEYARGKYISLCASDDFWCLNKLELQVDFMENHPNIPMSYGKNYLINEKAEPLSENLSQKQFLRGGDLFEDIFLFKLHPPVNYIYKATLFKEIGYYNEDNVAEDYYMNLKVASNYQIGFIDQYLSYYRVDTRFQKVIRFDKVSDSHLMTIEEYKDHPFYKKAKTLVYLRKFGVFAPYKKHKGLAFKNCLKSINFFYKRAFIVASIKFVLYWK